MKTGRAVGSGSSRQLPESRSLHRHGHLLQTTQSTGRTNNATRHQAFSLQEDKECHHLPTICRFINKHPIPTWLRPPLGRVEASEVPETPWKGGEAHAGVQWNRSNIPQRGSAPLTADLLNTGPGVGGCQHQPEASCLQAKALEKLCFCGRVRNLEMTWFLWDVAVKRKGNKGLLRILLKWKRSKISLTSQ